MTTPLNGPVWEFVMDQEDAHPIVVGSLPSVDVPWDHDVLKPVGVLPKTILVKKEKHPGRVITVVTHTPWSVPHHSTLQDTKHVEPNSRSKRSWPKRPRR